LAAQLEPHRAFIMERIGRTPHLTLHALKDELAARGVKVSHNAVWLFLRREGLRFKKTLFALEQARSDIARRRRRWRSWQASLDPRRLVFIDETWIKTSMAPLRGWGPKRARVRGFAPHGHWRTLTFLAALRCDELTAPCVSDGPINGECFRAYVEQQLVPVLKQGDIVIMDNLGSHKSAALLAHQGRRREALLFAARPRLVARPQSDRAGLRQDQALDALRPKAHR
jgi:DDE superfamily endonuclease